MMILGEYWDEYEGLGDLYDAWDPFEGSDAEGMEEASAVLGANE